MNMIEGDLISLALEGRFDVIVHGCNCFCTMGAGIARAIQEEFPEAYAADMVTIKGDRGKLGDFSFATVKRAGHEITIVNGYTQFQYYGQSVLVDYQAIRQLFQKIRHQFSGKKIGYPKIGAGLAGGDWARIAEIIDRELADEDHCLVMYVPDRESV
jgi:O-acetyl-ADP-ribose deacetylase (regulator of RNase III)